MIGFIVGIILCPFIVLFLMAVWDSLSDQKCKHGRSIEPFEEYNLKLFSAIMEEARLPENAHQRQFISRVASKMQDNARESKWDVASRHHAICKGDEA